MKNLDIITIGDVSIDAFIRLKEAEVHCDIDNKECTISMAFGAKIPYESFTEIPASGNSANAAITASRLGLKTEIITNIGKDYHGGTCLETLKKDKVDVKYVKSHEGLSTNYHFLLWYGKERTILTEHIEYPYTLPKIKDKPKWIYLSSLSKNSTEYHSEILQYLNENPDVKFAFQPGTFQINSHPEFIQPFYERADVCAVNTEEAKKILRYDDSANILELVRGIKSLGPKMVILTDSLKGSYLHNGKEILFMPIYPDTGIAIERTGCGDAFFATFISMLIKGKSPEEALEFAPINSMSVSQYVGSQKGLLDLPALLHLKAIAPDNYKIEKVGK